MNRSIAGEASGLPGLVRAARGGCSTSFRTLLDHHRRDILAVLQRQTRRTHEVDELYQDVAVRAYRALPDLRDPDRFPAWLVRIAYNASVDWIRRRRVRRRTARLDGDPADPAPPERRDRHAEESESRLPHLVNEIARLSPRHAAAILLRGLEGMAYTEIADCLNVSIPCVKTSLHRARRRLRSRMAATAMSGLPRFDPPAPHDDIERNQKP